MNLELAAMRWLWLDKGCHIVLEQRSPRYMMGNPDVIGITKSRYITEIEIKRSASDFAADFRKRHRINREFYLKQQPRQFYYLMPEDLALRVQSRVPSWAGLMACPFYPQINILKIAPVNEESGKLNSKECVRLARLITNHMMGYAVRNENQNQSFKDRDSLTYTDWVRANKGTYAI
jgi:hypothetical protein